MEVYEKMWLMLAKNLIAKTNDKDSGFNKYDVDAMLRVMAETEIEVKFGIKTEEK